MAHKKTVVIEVFGEGKTDVGIQTDEAVVSERGVVPILTKTLCGKPKHMLVKPKHVVRTKGKTLSSKVRFAKRQANYNKLTDAVIFVIDSEGDRSTFDKKIHELRDGRDFGFQDFPMAVGVAHPCIESWLLTDAAAICRALDLPSTPEIPNEPEKLPAPSQNRENNPKTVLRDISGQSKKELPTKDKDMIAAAMNDMDLVRKRCPLGFAPFADEVQQHIHPLF